MEFELPRRNFPRESRKTSEFACRSLLKDSIKISLVWELPSSQKVIQDVWGCRTSFLSLREVSRRTKRWLKFIKVVSVCTFSVILATCKNPRASQMSKTNQRLSDFPGDKMFNGHSVSEATFTNQRARNSIDKPRINVAVALRLNARRRRPPTFH